MERLLEKLDQGEDTNTIWKDWSLEEQKKLLDIYLIICKKEHHIFKLIYNYHGCDSWEDIFRDYSVEYLDEKQTGVQIAINGLIEHIEYLDEKQTDEHIKDK